MNSISAVIPSGNGHFLPLFKRQVAGYVQTNGKEPVAIRRENIFGDTVEISGVQDPIGELINIYHGIPPAGVDRPKDFEILSEDIGAIYKQYIIVKNAIYTWSNISLTA